MSKTKTKRECITCKREIKECMGFVLARDINETDPRELCEHCSWTTNPEDID